MTLPFNRPEFSQALAKLLGVKGEFPLEVRSDVMPVFQLQDLSRAPYLQLGNPCGENIQLSGVALEQGYVLAQPGPNVALEIHQVIFGGDADAVGATSYSFVVLTAAQIATAGLASTAQMVNLNAQQIGTNVSSKVIGGTHTTLVGNAIAPMGWPANPGATITPVIWTLAAPVTLYGNDPSGIGGMGIVNNVANQALRVGFVCKEWPLPG